MTRCCCCDGQTPPGRSAAGVRSTTGRRADLQRLLQDDGSVAATTIVPFVPAPLQRARTVRRREPVAVATGQRWSMRRRSNMAGAAVVALVIAVLSLSVLLAPGRGGPVPAFAATPPVLHTTSTGASAGTVLGRLARVARAAHGAAADLRRVSYERWSLANRINGLSVTVAVVPERVELTWKPDGSAVARAVTGTTLLPEPGLPPARGRRQGDQRRGTPDQATRSTPGAVPPGLPARPRRPRRAARYLARGTPSTATAPVSCSPP